MEFARIFDLIREMNRERVDFIIFGAVALNLHGIVRATTDAGFFIRADRDNIERRKYRSIEEAQADRDRWEQDRVNRIRAARKRK